MKPSTRRPITDPAALIDAQGEPTRRALIALGELLIGVKHLGEAATEEHVLAPVARLTTALALAELIDEHDGAVEIGPGMYADPPAWMQTTVGDIT